MFKHITILPSAHSVGMIGLFKQKENEVNSRFPVDVASVNGVCQSAQSPPRWHIGWERQYLLCLTVRG